MRAKILSLLIALGLALSQTHQASADDGPVYLGTFRAIGERGTLGITQEPGRKVKHSDAPSQVFIVFEDGSWVLDADGIFPYDVTGCYAWGICE